MQTNPLFAALLAAAFAFPLAANAGGGDKTSKQASANGSTDGGAEAMFKALDKDGDGNITKAEALGTPHHADFDKLDKNADGKLTREEHAAAPEHASATSAAGSTASGSSATSPTPSVTTSTPETSGGKKAY
jgi:hypothetical protein